MHVRVGAARNADAVVASRASTWNGLLSAQERLSQRPGGVELARTGRAQEQIGVARATTGHGAREEVAHARLRIELGEEAVGSEVIRHG